MSRRNLGAVLRDASYLHATTLPVKHWKCLEECVTPSSKGVNRSHDMAPVMSDHNVIRGMPHRLMQGINQSAHNMSQVMSDQYVI